MNCRMSKLYRLRKSSSFRKVFEEGVFASNLLLTIHLLPNPNKTRRVGFSAGKKLGSAVVRNRCKRRLRECYRLHQQEVPIDMDMVIVARRNMITATWPRLVKAFLEMVQRSRINLEKKRGDRL